MHDAVCICLQPVIADRAEGSYVWTTDGQKHLDMSGGTLYPHILSKQTALAIACSLTFCLQPSILVPDLKDSSCSGIGVTSTGHCHPKVVKAIQDQAAKFIHAQQNVFTASVPQVILQLYSFVRRLGRALLTCLQSTSAASCYQSPALLMTLAAATLDFKDKDSEPFA